MIRFLSDETINKLAAGEIIHSCSQSIKELYENSIDAGAQNISIVLTQYSIIISNDNSVISHENHNLLCHRFCTSKISEFQDLESHQQFGFRGEALAAMSYVAKVTCISGGYQSIHQDGQMTSITPHVGFTSFQIDFKNLEVDQNVFKTIEILSMLNFRVSTKIHFNDVQKQLGPFDSLKLSVDNYFQSDTKEIPLHAPNIDGSIYFSTSVRGSVIIINNRLIQNKKLQNLVVSLIQRASKTIQKISILLILQIPINLTDFNCHPQKLNILLMNQSQLETLIEQEISNFILVQAKNDQKLMQKSPKSTLQLSPVLKLRQIDQKQQITSQHVQIRLKRDHRYTLQFKAHPKTAFPTNPSINVIGSYSNQYDQFVIIQDKLQLFQLNFTSISTYLSNLVSNFIQNGLSVINPLIHVPKLTRGFGLSESYLVSPLALLPGDKFADLYDLHKRELVPSIRSLEVTGCEISQFYALFAKKIFKIIGDDRGLLYEVLRCCDVRGMEVIGDQYNILKFFNRL